MDRSLLCKFSSLPEVIQGSFDPERSFAGRRGEEWWILLVKRGGTCIQYQRGEREKGGNANSLILCKVLEGYEGLASPVGYRYRGAFLPSKKSPKRVSKRRRKRRSELRRSR